RLNDVVRPVEPGAHAKEAREIVLHLKVVRLRVLADQVGVYLVDDVGRRTGAMQQGRRRKGGNRREQGCRTRTGGSEEICLEIQKIAGHAEVAEAEGFHQPQLVVDVNRRGDVGGRSVPAGARVAASGVEGKVIAAGSQTAERLVERRAGVHVTVLILAIEVQPLQR